MKQPIRHVEHEVWKREEVFPYRDFPLAVWTVTPQDPHCLHVHQGFSELVVIFGGRGTHFTGDESYPVAAGDVFVIPESLPHGYRDVDRLDLVDVPFDGRHFLDPIPHLKKLPGYHALFDLEPRYRKQHRFDSRLRLEPQELGHVIALVEQMDEELTAAAPGYELAAMALFMQVVGRLCRSYERPRTPASRNLLQLGRVLSHLERNYADPVTLEELCRLAQTPKRSFLRAFRAATGRSPIQYLIRLRLRRACELLRTTDMAVTDVAFATGFEDSNYMARQFRRLLDVSPGAYRKGAGGGVDVTPSSAAGYSAQPRGRAVRKERT